MIPTQAADITVDWLNERLEGQVGTISEFSSVPIGEGVGILGEVTRLSLSYAPGESGPASMIAKCQSAFPENVGLCQMMGFYEREVRFYQELSSAISVRTPRCYVADMADGGSPFVLLMEEVTGAKMIDQIVGATLDEALAVAETVAKFQAPFWNNEAVQALSWLPPMNNDLYKGAQMLAEANWEPFVANWADKVPAEALAWAEQLTPLYPVHLDWWAENSPPTMAHTDCRAENYLFGGSAGANTVTMLDFQLTTKHVGTFDIANFLGASVTIENRRAFQDQVVKQYHDTLLAEGVGGYDFDQCWRDYRYSQLMQAWAQLAIANIDPGNERGRMLLNEFVTRSFQAAADNNSGELLDEL